MMKKIVGIFVLMLLITTALPALGIINECKPLNVQQDMNPIETKRSAMFSQLPFETDEDFKLYVSDLGWDLRVHDDYWGLTEGIDYIAFWGLCLRWENNAWVEVSNPEDLKVGIIFWDSLLGIPLYDLVKYPQVSGTNKYYDGFELQCFYTYIFEWVSILDGWISIQSYSHPEDGMFIWIGSDDGNQYAYQEGHPEEPERDTDVAFQLFSEEGCADLDVEKYVWEPTKREWIDADTEGEAVRLPIGEEMQFKIKIKSNGTCPLTDIEIYDKMFDNLKFISSDPEPDEYLYMEPFYYLKWNFSGPLKQGEIIDLYITASVEGPDGNIAYNFVKVIGIGVTSHNDSDFAYVNAYTKPRNINTHFTNLIEHFMQLYPNLFLKLRQIF